jgi:hypothetical protein
MAARQCRLKRCAFNGPKGSLAEALLGLVMCFDESLGLRVVLLMVLMLTLQAEALMNVSGTFEGHCRLERCAFAGDAG